MRKILIILTVVVQFVHSQTSNTHVSYFDTDKHSVTETETNRLILFIENLKKKEVVQVSIFGFTDDRGADNYNLDLSLKRAEAIKKIFYNEGVNEALISNVDGKGEVLLRVVSTKDINIIRGLNRKVEINIEYKKVSIPINKLNEKEELLNNKLSVGDKIRLENILFKTGYSSLEKESIEALEQLAKVLLKRKDVYFTIQGHVCCTKNSRDAIDLKTGKRNLSKVRAKYIYDYLTQKGIKRNRMKHVGLRNKYPLGGATKYDRRVEIKITYISKKN